MSWLQQATVLANTPKHSIIDVLRKNMKGWEEARDHKVLHASDITKPNFCPRQWAFYDILGVKPEGSYVGTALRATYDLGHAVARELIENWAGQSAVGNWKCRRCDNHVTMTKKPLNMYCQANKHKKCDWEYEEVNFVSQKTKVSGSIDVMFDLGTPKYALTELKTYAADEFDKMVAPLPEHRTRTNLYMKLVAESGSIYTQDINLHEARILYVSRGYGKKNADYDEILPFREFVVQRDDNAPDLVYAIRKAEQLALFREVGVEAMPGGICGSPGDKVAKSCKQCSVCFSGKMPSKQEWLV